VHPDLQRRLSTYLDEQGLGLHVQKVVPLTGDASDRKYFRVVLRDRPSLVLAAHAGPIDYAALPFVQIADLMARIPLPIPGLLHHSDALGIIGQEDLGDLTLQAHLGAADGAERAARYREAVAILATLQQRGAELASPAYPPYGIAFDVEKLTWELEFFVRHFLIAYRGATPSEAERAALREEWAALVEELAGEPRVLCHRDYHSRNLMLHDGRLYVIDFQDARMGPDTYDLVSLLRDSYVDVPCTLAGDLVDHFLALTGRGPAHRDEFERRMDVMGLQRNLKALGTFGFQTTSRANPVYLQYVPRTVRAVRAALDRRQPRFGRLRELLAGLVEDLRYN
jgi:aminoglycoside/choline kinase family phosphotransferase